MLIDINGDGLPDRVFDRNPSNDQQGFYVLNCFAIVYLSQNHYLYLEIHINLVDCHNTGNGFDSGKQWQSDLGGHSNWKNRPISNSIRVIVTGMVWTARGGWRPGDPIDVN
jgi:hypothetical protein